MSLFKRKQPAHPEGIELPILDDAGMSLEEKLRMEARTCATCGYMINNPMTDRCPRCFASVPLSEHTNCGDCSHQGNCEFKKAFPTNGGG